jgi:hypothetical protein
LETLIVAGKIALDEPLDLKALGQRIGEAFAQ